MPDDKLRRLIAYEAARLLYDQEESDYHQAKMKAVRRVRRQWVHPRDLPKNWEIRDQLQSLTRIEHGPPGADDLLRMRRLALDLMRTLTAYKPRLVGSVLTGQIRTGSDIDLHVFHDDPEDIARRLRHEGWEPTVLHTQRMIHGVGHARCSIRLDGAFVVDIVVLPTGLAQHPLRDALTGKTMDRASGAELEQMLAATADDREDGSTNRFAVFHALLAPLESVVRQRREHPESDALHHSLQVYDLVRRQAPFDDELQTAALLHDVGLAIDPDDPIAAGLEALDGFISPRTAWLIEHLPEGHATRDQTIGYRARRRLEQSDLDDLLILVDADRAGRLAGAQTSTVEEALAQLRAMSQEEE